MGSETDRDGHSRHPPNQTADCPWAPRTLHPIQTKKEGNTGTSDNPTPDAAAATPSVSGAMMCGQRVAT